MELKEGDKVTFDNDRIELFKAETGNDNAEIKEYQRLVLAGIDQVGTVKEYGHNITTVLFEDGLELPMPTKYLVHLP